MSINETEAPATETPQDAPVAAQEATETPTPTFTQDDMDKVAGKTRKEVATKYEKLLAEKEAELAEFKAWKDSQKTEAEKQAEAAKEWQDKYSQLEAKVKQSEIKAAVAAVNETTLSTDKLLRLLDIEDAEDATDAVKAFLVENPQLAKTPTAVKAPGAAKTSDASSIDPATDWESYVKAQLGV